MLSEKYIMKKVKEWAATPAGKKAIKEKYGVEYDPKKDYDFRFYAERMKWILYTHVSSVIKSISPGDILIGEPQRNADGKIEIKLYFKEGSLKRESLRPDLYPEGLHNIVLLFAHGYDAKNPIRGVWFGSASFPREIEGRQHRQPNNFLELAINEFNSKYKNIAEATLDDKYK